MSKFFKAFLPMILVVALLISCVPALAGDESPTTKVIASVKAKTTVYNGQVQTPILTVLDENGEEVPSSGYDYQVSKTAKNANAYKVTVMGKGLYTGEAFGTWRIKKAYNPFTLVLGRTSIQSSKNVQKVSLRARGMKMRSPINVTTTAHDRIGYEELDMFSGSIVIPKNYYGIIKVRVANEETRNYYSTVRRGTITVTKAE